MTSTQQTRRGVLGLFAAAAPAVALARPVISPAVAYGDWKTKPFEQWTIFDFRAEAEFHVAWMREKMATDDRWRWQSALEWWERELETIRGKIASPAR